MFTAAGGIYSQECKYLTRTGLMATFHVAQAASAKFGLHVGNMKFSTHKE
jgi:hypothetical protein